MAGFWITGDCHGDHDGKKLGTDKFPEGTLCDRSDVIAVTGDFGYWWNSSKSDHYWRKWLAQKKYTIVFVDGNHENFPMMERSEQVVKFGNTCNQLLDNVFWLRRGKVYEINGVKCFAFGGAMSTDKAHRTTYIDWWPEEQPSHAEFYAAEEELDKHNWDVDIVITHTAPLKIARELYVFRAGNEEQDPTEHMFSSFYERLKFKKWYFGHFHVDQRMPSDHRMVCCYNEIRHVKNELKLIGEKQ